MNDLEYKIKQIKASREPSSFVIKSTASVKRSLKKGVVFIEKWTDVEGLTKDYTQKKLQDKAGKASKAAGWVAGKVVKNIFGDIVTGITYVVIWPMKGLAWCFPDPADPKTKQTDILIAEEISNFSTPVNFEDHMEYLEWFYEQAQTKKKIYGKRTRKAIKKIHAASYKTLKEFAKDEKQLKKRVKKFKPGMKILKKVDDMI